MVEVLANAVRQRERPLAQPISVPVGAYTLTLTRELTTPIIRRGRRLTGTHNTRRDKVESFVIRALAEQLVAKRDRDQRAGLRGPAEVSDDDALVHAVEQVRNTPELREALARMWPRLTSERLLHDFLGSEKLIAAAGDGILDAGEAAVLLRARATSEAAVAWTVDDVALLDEADVLLGPLRGRVAAPRESGDSMPDGGSVAAMVERTLANALPDCPACGGELSIVTGPPASFRCDRFSCGETYPASALLPAEAQIRLNELIARVTDIAADTPAAAVRGREYAHVMVDEAQDLSPMQWRMLARRSPSRSMTIVGDLGQASTPWAPDSWTHALDELDVDVRHADLSVNYRTPREVMSVAAGVLAAASPNLDPPSSVRSTGQWPEDQRVADRDDLEATAVRLARHVHATHVHGRVRGDRARQPARPAARGVTDRGRSARQPDRSRVGRRGQGPRVRRRRPRRARAPGARRRRRPSRPLRGAHARRKRSSSSTTRTCSRRSPAPSPAQARRARATRSVPNAVRMAR